MRWELCTPCHFHYLVATESPLLFPLALGKCLSSTGRLWQVSGILPWPARLAGSSHWGYWKPFAPKPTTYRGEHNSSLSSPLYHLVLGMAVVRMIRMRHTAFQGCDRKPGKTFERRVSLSAHSHSIQCGSVALRPVLRQKIHGGKVLSDMGHLMTTSK